jgi:quinol monooxygenase YgiN
VLTITAEFSVIKDNREKFLSIIKELIDKSQNEKGCEEYSLFNDKTNRESFILIEKWKNQNSIDLHNNSEHFKELVPRLQELNERDIVVKINTKVNF